MRRALNEWGFAKALESIEFRVLEPFIIIKKAGTIQLIKLGRISVWNRKKENRIRDKTYIAAFIKAQHRKG